YSVELNTEMSVDDFLAVAGTIEAVDVDTWLSAMPASVVHASQRAAVVDEMLADIPVPSGFDAGSVELADVAVTDRYQLGAHVTGQVACAWFAQWAEATRTGDAAAAAEAVDAMAGSRDWDILREMAGQGDWPVAVWEYADELVAGADDVVEATAGLEGSSPIEQRAAHGLGCDWAEPPTRPVGRVSGSRVMRPGRCASAAPGPCPCPLTCAGPISTVLPRSGPSSMCAQPPGERRPVSRDRRRGARPGAWARRC